MPQAGRILKVGIDSHVDYHNVGAGLAGQNIDGRAAVQEVEHHLRRDLARIGADPLVGDAVIAGEDIHRLAGDLRGGFFFAPGDVLRRHRFDLAQAAQRLGQRIQMLLRLRADSARRLPRMAAMVSATAGLSLRLSRRFSIQLPRLASEGEFDPAANGERQRRISVNFLILWFKTFCSEV